VTSRLVTFTVDGLHCAIALEQVEEVVAMPAITALPGLSERLLGMVNLHGIACLVVDLRRALARPATAVDPTQQLLILRVGDRRMAAAADRVEGVVVATADPVPSSHQAGSLIQGVVTSESRSILVLDASRLMDGLMEAVA